MFDKKIILLISLLLVTGSSYFIFHRKKDNNDEVNLADNSDNSINDVLNEDNQEESSNSFLKYFFLFIIVIIIAVIAFFAVKKFVKKKKTIHDDSDKELEKNNKNSKDDNVEDGIFDQYNKIKIMIFKEEKFNQELSKIKIEDLAEEIIARIKTSYQEVIARWNIKNYSPDNYLVDFYYTEEADVRNGQHNVIINNNNQKIFLKENKRVRDISVFNSKCQHIVVNLFIDFFEEIAKLEVFDNKYQKKEGCEAEKAENFERFIFIIMIVENFLKYVSEKKKEIRFISNREAAERNLTFSSPYVQCIAKGGGKILEEKIRKPNISNISDFAEKILKNERLDFFAIVLNKLINQYFPESRELNEKENNK